MGILGDHQIGKLGRIEPFASGGKSSRTSDGRNDAYLNIFTNTNQPARISDPLSVALINNEQTPNFQRDNQIGIC